MADRQFELFSLVSGFLSSANFSSRKEAEEWLESHLLLGTGYIVVGVEDSDE
jgi:hypothetical protein